MEVNARNGKPINHSEWPKGSWKKALKENGIRPRKFYATRHTFISTALTPFESNADPAHGHP